jgi:hypothetical protein
MAHHEQEIKMSVKKGGSNHGDGYIIDGSSGGDLTDTTSAKLSISCVIKTGDDDLDKEILLTMCRNGFLNANQSGNQKKDETADKTGSHSGTEKRQIASV